MEHEKNSEKGKNTKANIENKPSSKTKSVPPVRQTITSYKRMLKVNPLLKYQEAGVDIDQLLGIKFGKTSLKEGMGSADTNPKTNSSLEGKTTQQKFKKPEPKLLKRTQSLKLPRSNGLDMNAKETTIISGNLPLTKNHFKKPIVSNSLTSTSSTNTAKPKLEVMSKYLTNNKVEYRKPVEPKTKINSVPKNFISSKSKPETSSNKANLKTENVNNGSKQLKKEFSTVRRSVSSPNLQNRRTDIKSNVASIKSNSSQLKDNTNIQTSTNFPPEFSPILEENSDNENFIFKNPSAYQRRSICQFTPHSDRKNCGFESSTPAIVETENLKERLQKWVKARGKQLSSFQHLRYFGISKKTSSSIQSDDGNKENIEIDKESSENLAIISTPESSKIDLPLYNDISEEELPRIAKEAMVELQKLIKEDYPRAQCLGWLELIKEKYRKADEEPEYWECKAALEQSIGNVGNAVEFYKTAIIQGAEVSNVDKSLDQLLQKFSLLNISPNKSEHKTVDGDQERIVREARTVFKSTIIQCAVQERILKK